MKNIKNIGSKIIGVGKTLLMPDEDIYVADSVAELPAIKAFAKMQLVRITDDPVKATEPKAVEDSSAEPAVEAAAGKKASKKASAKSEE